MVQLLGKTVCHFLNITRHTFTIQFSNSGSWHLSNEVKNICLHKNLHMDDFGSVIHECQNLETTTMSFSS